jgi:hypothetical protein
LDCQADGFKGSMELAKVARLKGKIEKLKEEIVRLVRDGILPDGIVLRPAQ